MRKFLLLLPCLLFFCIASLAQNAEFTGTVTDVESKEPLAGATIKLDKARGGITDASGKFKISVAPGEYDVAISYTGYKTFKQKVTLVAGANTPLKAEVQSAVIQINQVVSVSQYKKNAAYETVSIEVVSQNQIKNTNSNDLGEVVNKTPGVLVQDGQINIRGASSYSYGVGSRTSVLVDGLSFMSADLGEAQVRFVPLENVKQVEVVKGPASVLYGSSALNGGINVISAWPTDYEGKTSIDINFGVFGNPPKGVNKWWAGGALPYFANMNFNYQRRIKQLQLVAGANITRNESNFELADETRVRGILKLRYLHPKITGLNFGINTNVMYETSNRYFIAKDLDSNILFRGAGSDDRYTRFTADPFVTYTSSKGHRISFGTRYLLIFRKGNGDDPNAVSHQGIGDLQYQYRWKNMLTFTAGLPFTIGSSTSNLYEGARINFNTAVYSQLEFVYKILTLQGGIRYEVIGVDTLVVTGKPVFRAGISVQAAKATFFRASWGQGYRVPTIGERYLGQPFTAGVYIVPNDTLKPESGWGLELGFKQGFKIGKFMGFFDASFFWQQYKDYVEYQFGLQYNAYGDGTKIFPDSLELGYPAAPSGRLIGIRAINISNAKIAGYEISLSGKGNIGPVGLQVLAGYTYTWPGQDNVDSTGKRTYTFNQFFKDMFVYNFKRAGADDPVLPNMLDFRIRHLIRGDLELSYWKCYLGGTISYVSLPEKMPLLFKAASAAFFGNADALTVYGNKHLKGDFVFDLRAGIHIKETVTLGFIVKNVTNRIYALRPGRIENLRNFTFQFRYNF